MQYTTSGSDISSRHLTAAQMTMQYSSRILQQVQQAQQYTTQGDDISGIKFPVHMLLQKDAP
jgi:hypothetical protein